VSEIDLIYDDFASELDALESMIATVGGASLGSRSRVASANAATLLLAALFEEFVRQIIRALFSAKAKAAADISVFPEKITANVWRRSLEMLARAPFDDVQSKSREVSDNIEAILRFCLSKDVQADVGKALSHNDNNMRPQQLNQLFNQIGVENMCGRACNSEALIDFLGHGTAGKATPELTSRLEAFFRRRNDIAHSVQFNSSSGPSELSADISLFRIFGKAIAEESIKSVTPPPRPRASSPAAA